MLSRAWPENYDRLYQAFAATALANGLPYRLEETNNFTGGAKDATDTFAASLWALDYLHWWAVHGASGMNLHNRRWILNTTIYPVTPADDGLKSGYLLHPIAYGIEALLPEAMQDGCSSHPRQPGSGELDRLCRAGRRRLFCNRDPIRRTREPTGTTSM